VFNCSFQFHDLNLNLYLLPGPSLGTSLLGVLLRFWEHVVTISGDIKGMFHQVHLLPEDKRLLQFVWWDMRREDPPDVYEWCFKVFLGRNAEIHNLTDLRSW